MSIEHVVFIGVGTSATLFFASCSLWLWRRAAFASTQHRPALAVATPAGASHQMPPDPAIAIEAAPIPVEAAPIQPVPSSVALDPAAQAAQSAAAEREAVERAALEQLMHTGQGGDLDGAKTSFFLKKSFKSEPSEPSEPNEPSEPSERAQTAYFVRRPAGAAPAPPRDKYDFGDGPHDDDAPVARSDTQRTAPTKRAGPPRGRKAPPAPPPTRPQNTPASAPRRAPPPPPPRRR